MLGRIDMPRTDVPAGSRPTDLMWILLSLALAMGACASPPASAPAPPAPTPLAGSPSPGPGATADGTLLYWASYEFHTEPRFQILFEGGTPVRAPDEVRVLDRSGAARASATTSPVGSEALRLCARGTTYGTVRASLPVSEGLFREFIRDESRFVVHVRFGSTWSPASLANLCHATQ